MYQYANSFSFTANPETGEFLLSFRQQHPVIEADGTVKDIAIEPIAEIVMNRAGLDALRNLLGQIAQN